MRYSTCFSVIRMLFGRAIVYFGGIDLMRTLVAIRVYLFAYRPSVCVFFYVNAHYANVLTVAEMDFYIKLFVSSVVYVYAHRAS